MSSIVAAIFSVVVSVGLPLGVLVYFIIAKRNLVVPWLLGLATFMVTQVLVRMPILGMLGGYTWFQAFATFQPVLYILVLSFTAGLFEEGGRWLAMRFFFVKDHTSWGDGVAFGIGHGGFEAIWLVGYGLLVMLFSDPAALAGFAPGSLWLGGIERLFAMMAHVAWSLIVQRSVKQKRGIFLLLAIGMHTVYNFAPLLLLQFGAPAWAAELVLGVFSVALLLYTLRTRPAVAKAD